MTYAKYSFYQILSKLSFLTDIFNKILKEIYFIEHISFVRDAGDDKK